MAYRLVGKDFTPPDIAAKVTGAAKYVDDFKRPNMMFARILRSPMPHARVRNIDTSEAAKVPGFVGVLLPTEVPHFPEPEFPLLTNQPRLVGAPILAIAAENEWAAAEAIEKVKIAYEPLPFVVDPLDSLFPGGNNAHEKGNIFSARIDLQEFKWTARDFGAVDDGQLPLGKAADEWKVGDVDAGFAKAKLVIDESYTTGGLPHHCMEPRSSFAYWENGKAIVHGSSQSQAAVVVSLARLVGVDPKDLVYVAEYSGGGFGSKIGGYPSMALGAHISKKFNRPVLMRLSRSEEAFEGTGRPSFQGRFKIGFAADGRITAVDMYVIQDGGAVSGGGDFRSAGNAVSIVYRPEAMRWRGIPVMTNTTPRGAQRGPGENQIAMAIEPLLDKAARELKIDRLAIRKINAPDSTVKFGAEQTPVTSAFQKDALDMIAAKWNWAEKSKLSGQRNGSKVTGIGLGQAYHSAGGRGFDGLVRITPDGKVHVHNGIGNLGTYSYFGPSIMVAETLTIAFEDMVIQRGDTRVGIPSNSGQGGSNTTFTHSRAYTVAALDAKAKLLEIAAKDLGGAPADYDLEDGKIVNKTDKAKTMTFAKAAARAIELAGKFSGMSDLPTDINDITKRGVDVIKGSGLIGVAKDNIPGVGTVPGLCAAAVQVEVDMETGAIRLVDYYGVTDCGTVIHPIGLGAQMRSGAIMGFGMALSERFTYDPQNGLPVNTGMGEGKLPTYLDVPTLGKFEWAAVEKADPQSPFGSRGVGEPAQGCAASAVCSAVSDALGGRLLNRTPITPDLIVNLAAGRPQSYKPLSVNTQ